MVQVIGAPIAAALLLMEGARGLHGWQWLFILEGAVTVVYAAILAVREADAERTMITIKQRNVQAACALSHAPVQMNLAATPRTAAFLNEDEREWVHDRQTQGWWLRRQRLLAAAMPGVRYWLLRDFAIVRAVR